MVKINKNKIIQKIKLLTDTKVLGILAFAVISLLVSWSGLQVIQKNYQLERKISADRQRNTVQQLENSNLALKNKYYESNQYLELAARRQFGKAAPGEKLYLIPDDVALAKIVDLPKPEKTKPQPELRSKYRQNFDAWMKFLFH
jgi:cell division protein FtsB